MSLINLDLKSQPTEHPLRVRRGGIHVFSVELRVIINPLLVTIFLAKDLITQSDTEKQPMITKLHTTTMAVRGSVILSVLKVP